MTVKKFRGWYIPHKQIKHLTPNQMSQVEQERIVYVGCVHGGDQRLNRRLMELVRNPPKILIFVGDLTGSAEMEEFKKRFYNYVYNRAKPYLRENPTISDEKLLSYIGLNPPKPRMTLKEGYYCLLGYQLKLQGYTSEEISNKLSRLTDSEIAKSIHYISSFAYYGDWVATLSSQTRNAVLKSLENSAQNLLKPINTIRAKGTEIVMVEGNWDNAKTSGVRIIAGEDINEYFDTKNFFVNQGFQFIDQITAKETATTFHIFLPYNVILDFEDIPPEKLKEIKASILKAKENNKPVIIVGHAEANLQIHNLFNNNFVFRGEQEKLLRNFGRAIAIFKPDEVIYAHQHNPIKDEKGVQVDPNAKYVLQIVDNEINVRLIKDTQQIGKSDGQVVVTYVPLRSIANLNVPLRGPRSLLNGDRQPIVVEL